MTYVLIYNHENKLWTILYSFASVDEVKTLLKILTAGKYVFRCNKDVEMFGGFHGIGGLAAKIVAVIDGGVAAMWTSLDELPPNECITVKVDEKGAITISPE